MVKQFVLHSCFSELLRRTNIMTDKGFNRFDERAARYGGESKMYTSSSIANSQRKLTEINKSDFITKIRIWVESDTVKL